MENHLKVWWPNLPLDWYNTPRTQSKLMKFFFFSFIMTGFLAELLCWLYNRSYCYFFLYTTPDTALLHHTVTKIFGVILQRLNVLFEYRKNIIINCLC